MARDCASGRARQPEVQHPKVVAPIGQLFEKQIVGFEISMDDPLSMGRLQARAGLVEERQRPLERQRGAARQKVGHRVTPKHLHHQIGQAVLRHAEVMDGDQVRVPQAAQQARLAAESRQRVGVTRGGTGHDLQRHVAIDPDLSRPIDHAHAPGAEPLQHIVAVGEPLPRQRVRMNDHTYRDSGALGLDGPPLTHRPARRGLRGLGVFGVRAHGLGVASAVLP